MDALPAALRSLSGAILMNCQRLGKLPQRKLCAREKRLEQVEMIVGIEAGADQHIDEPRDFPHAPAQIAQREALRPGCGVIAAMLQRIAVGLRRTGALAFPASGPRGAR
jgi:hypothetical protein